MACGHDASLGRQCTLDEPGCAGAGGGPAMIAGTDDPEPPPVTQPGSCRSVSMAFFTCASGEEMPGVPHLRAGQPYTLRLRGEYAFDTTFQVQGVSATCFAAGSFEPLTLPVGARSIERCIEPDEDLALLVTVVSGDPLVWSQGLMAEICEGCP